jgi:hypothetical protein
MWSILGSRIQIRIKVKSWTRTSIKVNIQKIIRGYKMEPWRAADDHNREAWRLKMSIGG